MTEAVVEHEEIEGLGEGEPTSWGDYPIDTLLIRNEQRTVHDVLRRIENDQFVMDPDFQRDFIWEESKQSRLIESVLMRIPLPVFYLAEDDQGRMIVVDGLQRLSTFQRFANDKLRLTLPDRPELHRKSFSQLAPKLQNRVEDCNLILYIIDGKAPDQTRLDIFERVNGGVPLSRQQMRNCLYMGNATRFLKDEAYTELFIKATGGSLRRSIMRDREFINRFCAFKILPLDSYRDMDDFLAESLRLMNAEPECLPALSGRLANSLTNNLHLFGRHAFRKHQRDQDSRSVINASLWDVMSTGLAKIPLDLVRQQEDELRDGFYGLLGDEEFVQSITYGTNDVKRVTKRFEMMNAMIKRVIGDH